MPAPQIYSPRGFQQITDMSASTALTVPSQAQFAMIQAEGADVRWRDDGTAPTTSVGTLLTAGNSMLYEGDLGAIRFIETATTAVLNVSYYA